MRANRDFGRFTGKWLAGVARKDVSKGEVRLGVWKAVEAWLRWKGQRALPCRAWTGRPRGFSGGRLPGPNAPVLHWQKQTQLLQPSNHL